MTTGKLTSDTRKVGNFSRVLLREYGEMVLKQGEQETLTIEADEELLPKIKTEVKDGLLIIEILRDGIEKLTSSLKLNLVKYRLTVKEITALEISGVARILASRLETDRLGITVSGAGFVKIDPLIARRLDVELPGAGNLDLAGQVADQNITVGGAGGYQAHKLESQSVKLKITGLGNATVWALKDLDVTITGLGSVRYFGSPKLQQSIHGLGSIRCLGNP